MEIYSMALHGNGYDYFYPASSDIHGTGLFSHVDIPGNSILFSCKEPHLINEIPVSAIGNMLLNINHSCNPNVMFNEDDELVSLRPIEQGEELLLDYSKLPADHESTMFCNCGHRNCRKHVKIR